MANIRVTCPACNTQLEIGDEHAGQEVECGNCLQVFVAKGPAPEPPKEPVVFGLPPKSAPKESAPPKRRRRRDDDDDDYEHDRDRRSRRDDDDYEYDRRSRRGEDTSGADGMAVAALVLGILSLPLVCCWWAGLPLAALAIIMGSLGMKSRTQGGLGTAGLVLGIISACLVAFLFMLSAGGGAWGRFPFR
jgi:predicted Zn finger-like uncharacterized protein